MADQSKIGCITQRRFAKVGTKTHPQRGAALDRNGLSVSTETACRFEPKSPVGNSEICGVERPVLPFPNLLEHGVGDPADQIGGDLDPVKLLQVSLRAYRRWELLFSRFPDRPRLAASANWKVKKVGW